MRHLPVPLQPPCTQEIPSGGRPALRPNKQGVNCIEDFATKQEAKDAFEFLSNGDDLNFEGPEEDQLAAPAFGAVIGPVGAKLQ